MRIQLVQISEQRYDRHYLPYTAGLLQAYAQEHCSQSSALEFQPILYRRQALKRYLPQLQNLDLAAFSVYIWNVKRSLALAQEVRRLNPKALILFGGPQIPERPELAEHWLRAHPWVDAVVRGEGESAFHALLETELTLGQFEPQARQQKRWQHWQNIPNLAWLAEEQYCSNPTGPRLAELDRIPSPYLKGIFDPLLSATPEQKWIATWESNRGCPFSCSFCDWGGLIQSRVYRFDSERLQAEIDWFGRHQILDIFCADANFGMLKRDLELVDWMGAAKRQYGAPHLFQTQTAKNVKVRNLEIQRRLSEQGLNPVAAISLQSLHPPTLKAIRRDNISTERYRELQAYCQEHQIYNYTDLIMGMPEETYDSFADGVDEVIRNGQHNRIMFNNAIVLPNAELGDPDYQRLYGLETARIPFPSQTSLDGIHEALEITVASRTLPRSDWRRTQILAWLCNFLYFTHQTCQPLFLVLHHETGLSFRSLLECFSDPERLRVYPLLKKIWQSLHTAAQKLQQGYTRQEENPLLYALQDGVPLTPELVLQAEISQHGLWPQFFKEVAHLLRAQLSLQNLRLPEALFQDALKMNQAHFYRIFYGQQTLYRHPTLALTEQRVYLSHDLETYYQSCLRGASPELRRAPQQLSYLGPKVVN